MIHFLAAIILTLATPTDDEIRPITWADLLPENAAITAPEDDIGYDLPGQQHDRVRQQTGSTETVRAMDGIKISMPGFMLPLDYTEKGKVSAFLLVPYYGACIHVPPPPPNQIVFVDTKDQPVESRGLWDPVTVTGTMAVKMNINGLGDAAYTLTLDTVEPYER